MKKQSHKNGSLTKPKPKSNLKFRKFLNKTGNAFVNVERMDLTIGDCSRTVCLDFFPRLPHHGRLSPSMVEAEAKRLTIKAELLIDAINIVLTNAVEDLEYSYLLSEYRASLPIDKDSIPDAII